MANRVTPDDIKRINELYYVTKVYAEVARQTGFSPSTVKKYVDKNWKPAQKPTEEFNMNSLPHYSVALEVFKDYEDYGALCELSDEEKKEIKELWTELSV